MITTGEGGALLTNNYKLDKKIKSLRSHGIIREKKYLKNKSLPKWYYEQKYLSSNYRMTAFQAALGISQLKKIDKFIKKRNYLARIYESKLKNLNIKFQLIKKDNKSSRHLFIILVHKKLRDKLYSFLDKNRIQTNLHYIPIYRHPYYTKFKFNKKKFSNSEKYYEQALSIPLHYSISKKEQNFIINKIKYFLIKYKK
jgi:dTDP-4-amino-4,6-dideoxygalactose transaminase